METNGTAKNAAEAQDAGQIRNGTYEILRGRLTNHGKELRSRLDKLNKARKEVFGGVDTRLLSSQRISTGNNCVPRDMVTIGDRFIFGYNVFVGLRAETTLEDVFAIYQWKGGSFTACPLDLMRNSQFETDFQNLYRYYRRTTFTKFSVIGHHLYMVFRVGREVTDVKTFKWLIQGGTLQYVDARSEHEYVFPPQHGFEWRRTTQDMIRQGKNPHISIEDRVFVETVGGDLTIKIEDNTETGAGIYSEPVDNADQTLSDAEIYYAVVGNVIVLKVRPYEEKRFRYIPLQRESPQGHPHRRDRAGVPAAARGSRADLRPGLLPPDGRAQAVRAPDPGHGLRETHRLARTARTTSTSFTIARPARTFCSRTTSSSRRSARPWCAAGTLSSRTACWCTSGRRKRRRGITSSRSGRHLSTGRTSRCPSSSRPSCTRSATGTSSGAWPSVPKSWPWRTGKSPT